MSSLKCQGAAARVGKGRGLRTLTIWGIYMLVEILPVRLEGLGIGN